MDFGFTDDQEALRKSAREVLTDRSTSAVVRAVAESQDGFDASLWKTIADLGWCGVAIAEADGGLGLGWVEQCILLEETGRAILPAPYLSTVGLAVPVLTSAEDDEFRRDILGRVASGETRVTLAHLEAGEPSTVAERDGAGYVLSGTKAFVPDAQAAGEILVVARTGAGNTLFAVPAASCEITQMDTLDRTRRLCEVRLDAARVDATRMIGGDGGAGDLLRRAFDRSAVAIAAEETGIAARVLEMSVEYTRQREQFGRAIGSFQAVSHKLADMLLLTESARSSVYYGAWALEEGTPDAALAAASARVAGIEAGRFATAEGIQVHGGIGFTWEHDLHLYFRRAKWDELYLGDAGEWRERIASLLAG